MPYLRCGFLGLLLLAPLSAQVIPVSGGGPALAQAIAAAPSGAVLMVAPGTYDGVTFVLNKDLTILAPQRATITDRLEAVAGSPTHTLRVVNLDLPQTSLPYPPWVSGGLLRTVGHLLVEHCTCARIQIPDTGSRRRVHIANTSVGRDQISQLLNVDAVLVDSAFSGGGSGKVTFSGLQVTGSLRAERITVASGNSSTPGIGLMVDGVATIADSTLRGAVGLPTYGTWGKSIDNTPPGALTLSNCSTPEGVSNAYQARPLVTARWHQRTWTVGGAASLDIRANSQEPVLLVAAWHLLPWQPPFAAEPIYAGATPLWCVVTVGSTDAQGRAVLPFALPNTGAARHFEAWLTAVGFDPAQLRTSVPLGGVIQ
jgi:hypothetical protein